MFKEHQNHMKTKLSVVDQGEKIERENPPPPLPKGS